MAFTDNSQKVLTAGEVDERIAKRLQSGQELKVCPFTLMAPVVAMLMVVVLTGSP